MQKGEVTIRGDDVIGLVLMKLAEDKANLRSIGKEVLGDLEVLAKNGYLTARLNVMEEPNGSGDFKLVLSFAVTDEEYAEATGQVLCVVCNRWNESCADRALGSVCDECWS